MGALPNRISSHYVTSAQGYQLYVLDCPTCGVVSATTREYEETRRKDGKAFYCPNGHSGSFPVGKTEEQRLREQLNEANRATERERKSREWAEQRAKGANISAGMARASERRLRARVGAGVCPCCNRTFQQLARHMKSKHPEGK